MKKHPVYIAPKTELADYWENSLICTSGDGQSEDYGEEQFPW